MKKFISLFLASVMIASLTACNSTPSGSQTPKASEPVANEQEGNTTPQEPSETSDLPTIGVTIYKYDDNFMSFTRKAVEKAADGKATLIMNDSQNDQSKQNDQIDAMIAKGVKALAINLVDPGSAATVVEKAKNANLPIVLFNKEPVDGAASLGYDKVWYVGTTSSESGVIQGELIVDYLKQTPDWDKNGDNKLQYVMLMGEPGHPDAEARTKFSVQTIVDNGYEVEELAKQTGMWDASKAKDLTDTWLAASGDKIEMIICNNDGMALGAIESLKAANKKIPVVGVDAIPEALELIKTGEMLGTVLNDPLNQGKVTIELAINAANGKDVLEGTSREFDESRAVRVPYVGITKDNISVAEEAYK